MRLISTSIAGLTIAEIHHRHQALASGQQARFAAVLPQDRDQLVLAARREILKGGRLHDAAS